MKIRDVGSVVWDREFGGLTDEFGYYVIQTSDSGFVTVGQTMQNDTGVLNYDMYFVKTNKNG